MLFFSFLPFAPYFVILFFSYFVILFFLLFCYFVPFATLEALNTHGVFTPVPTHGSWHQKSNNFATLGDPPKVLNNRLNSQPGLNLMFFVHESFVAF